MQQDSIGYLKMVTETVCELKSVDLSNDDEKTQQVLRLWNSCVLTVEGIIIIFKILAILKIPYLALITNFPKVIVEELKKKKEKRKRHDKTQVLK